MRTKISSCLRFSLGAVFALGIIFALPVSYGSNDERVELFTSLGISPANVPADIRGISKRGHVEAVRINMEALTSRSPGLDKVRMSLFNGRISIDAERMDLDRALDGAVTWYGAPEVEDGTILFSIYKDSLYGRIEYENAVYKIEPAEAPFTFWLYELDYKNEMDIDDGGLIPDGIERLLISDIVAPKKGKTVIDVLVLYTNGFAAAYPGSKLGAQINFLIGVWNTSFKNGKVKAKMRVVKKKKVKYTDDGDLSIPLNEMTKATGKFKRVPKWRNKFGADLVTLLRVFKGSASNKACGKAWLMTVLSKAFEKWAFSVVQVGRFPLVGGSYSYCTDQTLAHEGGHNMGSHHNKGDKGVYSYSVGYRKDGVFRTVLSYKISGESRISYFSSPKVKYLGDKTGTSVEDNGRSINNVKSTVAGWRATKK